MAETETYKYQTYRGNFYVITTDNSSTTITDSNSGMQLATIAAHSQGIIFAVGKEITASNPVKINIVR